MRTRTGAIRASAVIAAVLMAAATLAAQGDRVEKKVPFQIDKSVPIDGLTGPVKITTLKVTDLGRGYGRGGLSLRSASPPSELSTTLRFAFDVSNPSEDEWEVTFTLELLDKSGKVIDRTSKKQSYEDESKVLNIEHPLLEYVLPLISDVRVTLQGKRK